MVYTIHRAAHGLMQQWGAKGGNARSVKEIKNKLAEGYIDKNFGLIKIAAEKVLGIDVNELLDDYGADNILEAVTQLAPKLGLNFSDLISGGLPKDLLGGTTKRESEYGRFEK